MVFVVESNYKSKWPHMSWEEQVPVSASRKGALDNGWKPHPVRNNQPTGSESWNRSGNVRFKRRQLGGRDGH